MTFIERYRGPGRLARSRRLRLRRSGALALAVLAVWAAWGAFRPAAGQTRTVTVAARDMPAGSTITAADLRTVRWPTGAVVPGLIDRADAVGRRTIAAISSGEPVTTSRVGSSNWVSLGADERAFTVPLADAALARLLKPGDRIDLYDPTDHRLLVSAARVVMSATQKVQPLERTNSEFTLVIAVNSSESRGFAAALGNSATVGTGLIAAARPPQ